MNTRPKGYHNVTYIQLERKPRPHINKEDFELYQELQFRTIGEDMTQAQLDAEVEAYLNWNEDKGEEFHNSVLKFQNSFLY